MLVITGFEPFAEHSHNSSASIVERLRELDLAGGVHGEVLPTSYARAGSRIEQIVGELRPRALIMLGLWAKSHALRLERLAKNLDGAELPDNDGERRRQTPIIAGAAASYESTLPLERCALAVRAVGCPVELSEDAGCFVCNHVYYRARQRIEAEKLEIRCGFLHVPAAPPEALEPWLSGVRACIEFVVASPAREV